MASTDCPQLWHGHLEIGKHFQEKRLEFLIRAVDLVDEQHWRALVAQTVNGEVTFPSEVRAGAVRHGDLVVPSANVRAFHAKR